MARWESCAVERRNVPVMNWRKEIFLFSLPVAISSAPVKRDIQATNSSRPSSVGVGWDVNINVATSHRTLCRPNFASWLAIGRSNCPVLLSPTD